MKRTLAISTHFRSKNIKQEMQPITPCQTIGDDDQPNHGDLTTLKAYQMSRLWSHIQDTL